MNDWIRAEEHAERARELCESGRWELALRELGRALAVDPQRGQWHLEMATAFEALGRPGEAAASFARALELGPRDVEVMARLGAALLHDDRPEEAVEVLARVIEADPDHEPGYCYRIDAYARLGRHEEAEQMFYLARLVVDECPRCYDHIAHSLAARGKLAKAVWCWRQSLRLEPSQPGVRVNLALAYRRMGRFEKARRQLEQHLLVEPADVGAMLDLGRLLIEAGPAEEAAEQFQAVLELDPTVAEAHLHLGELALMAGHLDAAERLLATAARLEPDMAWVHLRWAQCAARRRRPGHVMAHLRRELRCRDDSPVRRLELARMLVDHRAPDIAVPLLDELEADLRARPEEQARHVVMTLFLRGSAHLEAGRFGPGQRDCRRVLRHAPCHVLAMHNLAVACLRLGRDTRARYWLRRARALRPHDRRLRALQRRANRRAWARRWLGFWPFAAR